MHPLIRLPEAALSSPSPGTPALHERVWFGPAITGGPGAHALWLLLYHQKLLCVEHEALWALLAQRFSSLKWVADRACVIVDGLPSFFLFMLSLRPHFYAVTLSSHIWIEYRHLRESPSGRVGIHVSRVSVTAEGAFFSFHSLVHPTGHTLGSCFFLHVGAFAGRL